MLLSRTSDACHSRMLMPCWVSLELAAHMVLRELLTGLEHDTVKHYT